MTHFLFAYGTLKEPDVQDYVFRKQLHGKPDVLPGYRLSDKKMYGRYLVLERSLHNGDEIPGMVYQLSEDDLHYADVYEGPGYKRLQVPLASGCSAWVYVEKENSENPG